MTKDAQEIIERAMALVPEERALVAHKLLRSLEPQLDEDVEAAWQAEAARRLKELDEGTVQPVTWESVRGRLA